MKRVLLTGMSGTGKSTLIRELAARGYHAIDADDDGWSEYRYVAGASGVSGASRASEALLAPDPQPDWVWREDRIQALLSTEDADVLFLSGCATNQVKFYAQFDHIVLLTAPAPVLVARLTTRTTNSYGKRPEEVARVLHLKRSVEPLLRRVAELEVDTSAPLDQVVATVLQLIQPQDE